MSDHTIIIRDEDEFEDGRIKLDLESFQEVQAVLAYLRNWLLDDSLGAVAMTSDLLTFRVMRKPDSIVEQIAPATRRAWDEVMSEAAIDDTFAIRNHIDECDVDKEDPEELAKYVIETIQSHGGDPAFALEDALRRQFEERLADDEGDTAEK
jgi:hypothetical protein